jgi:hypothetical protein
MRPKTPTEKSTRNMHNSLDGGWLYSAFLSGFIRLSESEDVFFSGLLRCLPCSLWLWLSCALTWDNPVYLSGHS